MTSMNSVISSSPTYPGLPSKKAEAAVIVSKLTLQEKIQLCSGHGLWHLKEIPSHATTTTADAAAAANGGDVESQEEIPLRHKNNKYKKHKSAPGITITDGPHGLRKTLGEDLLEDRIPATCFPTASALASSWDVQLLHKVGVTLAHECVAAEVGVLLGPGMNIKRHPCCGRNFEYFSEDPYLTGKMGSAYIQGVQSQGVGTSMKHICVNNQEHDRMRVSATVDERTLREIYLKGFETAIRESQPWTVMCAYNKLNGVYCSEHPSLWNQILRKEWGFQGIVMTDWGACSDRIKGINAGLDLEMPGSYGAYDSYVEKAVLKGKIQAHTLDEIVERNVCLALLAQDALDKQQPYREVDLESHHLLARKVAMECAVLLKNQDNILPLAKNTSVALIGEFAKHPRYQGKGSSEVKAFKLDCAFDRMGMYTDNFTYSAGYKHDDDGAEIDQVMIEEAVEAAKKSSVAVILCGLPGICESEGFDRPNLSMPPVHNILIEKVTAVNPNTIVILSNGQAVAMPWADKPKAILEGYLSGQASGSAMVDLVFGVASPCGKLAETFPITEQDVPSNTNFPGREGQVQYREGLNVGYRYFNTAKAPVRFPFGHGLTYTSFEYTQLKVSHVPNNHNSNIGSGNNTMNDIQVKVEMKIRNTGQVAAAEVVQCYVRDCESTVYRPTHELKGFVKVFLQPEEEMSVVLDLGKDAFQFFDVGHQSWVVESGEFEIQVGSSSRDIRLSQNINVGSSEGSSSLSDSYNMDQQLAVSTRAQMAHPPSFFFKNGADDTFHVPDDFFTQMLGHPIPPNKPPSKKFHRNSTVSELPRSWFIGNCLHAAVMYGAKQHMREDKSKSIKDDKVLKKMVEEMTGQVPLRSLVLFSEGRMGFTLLDVIIGLMNWQFIHCIKVVYKSIFGTRIVQNNNTTTNSNTCHATSSTTVDNNNNGDDCQQDGEEERARTMTAAESSSSSSNDLLLVQ